MLVGEPPEGFEIRTGSETLRRGPFVLWIGRLYLVWVSVLIEQCLDFQYLELWSVGVDSTGDSSEV